MKPQQTAQGTGCVVVGVDPGWRADGVVRTAAREAARRGATLAIVAVARRSKNPSLSAEGLAADDGWSEAVARRALADAYDALGDVTGRVTTVTTRLWDETDPESEPLRSAELLVLGSRGRHGRLAFGLTSVSRKLLKAVRCPVLAVPEPAAAAPWDADAPGPVVAGVGEHPWDAAVLTTAAREAAARGADLYLVHGYVARTDETLTAGLRRAAQHATHATEGLDPGPGTSVTLMLTQEAPATALLRQAHGAQLIVIGSRPGALSGLVLDSVSRPVLEAPPCPVLVVQRGEAAHPDQPARDVADVAAVDPGTTVATGSR
jgi:nucleotide-binding universal stress UspA family protein